MTGEKNCALKRGRRVVSYAAVILPSLALGVLAMIAGGVSLMLWGQQIAAFVVFALLAAVVGRSLCRVPDAVCAAVLVLVLFATLFGAEAGGARRWLDLAVFNVNAAMLVLPALLILLGGMELPYPVLLCAGVILALQPDASQLTALCAAAVPVLWRHRRKRIWNAAAILVLAACMLRGYTIPVTIEPVSYCEGVLALLGGLSPALMAAGALSLALVPALFACRFRRERAVPLLSLTIYYAVTMLFALSGEYPMPFMGFGLSPIAGYWLAYLLMPDSAEAK